MQPEAINNYSQNTAQSFSSEQPMNKSISEQDKHSTSFFKKAWHKWLFRLGIMLLLVLLVELGVFNNYYWRFDADTYPTHTINLPYLEPIQRNAAVVVADNPTLTLTDIHQNVSAIYIEAYGGSTRVTGNILASSESYAYSLQPIASFFVASGFNQNLQSPAHDYQRFTVKFDLLEKVSTIAIQVDKERLSTPWFITKIVINPEPELKISFTRIILMLLLSFLAYATVCSKLYRHQLLVNSQSYNWLNRSIFAVMVCLSCGFFVAYHPYFASNSGFKTLALGLFPYTTPNKTVLQSIPTNQKALGNLDPYIQLTDAILVKKQLNLDLWVDPNLMHLNNVYDRTERDAKRTQYYWDRAFYNGKYYCYYGLAPFVLIYAPIYLMTGLVPSPALAVFIASLWALLGLHLLSSQLLKLFCTRCNTTLFILTKLSLFMSSYIFYLQGQFVFYNLPYLLGMAFTCIALFLSLSLWFKTKSQSETTNMHLNLEDDLSSNDQEQKIAPNTLVQSNDGAVSQQDNAQLCFSSLKQTLTSAWFNFKTMWQADIKHEPFAWNLSQMLAMFGCGLCVVLVVMSRPLTLLFLIATIGLIYLVYLLKAQQSILNKLINSLCLFLPVLIGAVVICAYNHARFDSIFEFGQFKQFTVDDVNYNPISFNFAYLKTMLFHILFANVEYSSIFPFVGNYKEVEVNAGQYHFITEHFGLMTTPYYWGLLLLPIIFGVKQFADQTNKRLLNPLHNGLGLLVFKLSFVFWYIIAALILLFTIYNAGWINRYLTDCTMLAVMIPFLSIMLLKFNWNSTIERIFYLALVFFCLQSIALMFFLAINNGSVNLSTINPRLFMELKEIFDPLSFS